MAVPRTAVSNDSQGIVLSEQEFTQTCDLIKSLTGISMSASKRQLVTRRISGRVRALNMTSVAAYLDYLSKGDKEEVESFTNAVTTNLTSFFREKHHFELLESTVMPDLIALKKNTSRRLRIWSAGCSTGEESYSIAMCVNSFAREMAGWDVKILCTDLDTDVLATAKAGVYPEKRIENVPMDKQRKWIKKVGDDRHMSDQLKSMMTFKQLNLMQGWPMRGKFDIIFCRNVVIYFDKPTQRVLMDRYADIIEDHGHLFLGHSESLYNVTDRFHLIGQTVYSKVD